MGIWSVAIAFLRHERLVKHNNLVLLHVYFLVPLATVAYSSENVVPNLFLFVKQQCTLGLMYTLTTFIGKYSVWNLFSKIIKKLRLSLMNEDSIS